MSSSSTPLSISQTQADQRLQHGINLHKHKDYAPAAVSLHQALGLYEQLKYVPGIAQALLELGAVYGRQRRYDLCQNCFGKALENFDAVNDRLGRANGLISWGKISLELSQCALAVKQYKEAKELYAALENPSGTANALNHLGRVKLCLEQFDDAIADLNDALKLYRNLGQYQQAASSLMGIANVYLSLRQSPMAISQVEQALVIYRKIGDRHGEAQALFNMALAHRQEGDMVDAEQAFQESLMVAQQIDAQGIVTKVGRHLATLPHQLAA